MKNHRKKGSRPTVIIVDGFQGMCQNYGLWFQSGFTRKVLLVLEGVADMKKKLDPCFHWGLVQFFSNLVRGASLQARNFKKVQANKLVKSNKSNFFMWNCIYGSFKLFPSSKIDFWPFLKLQKLFNFMSFFSLDFFKLSSSLLLQRPIGFLL